MLFLSFAAMKIICIGRNYGKHILELGNERPDKPVIFMKPDSAILQKKQPFFIPQFTSNVHYEAEVIVRINRLGKSIPSKFASKYYDQISLGIDFTARDLQEELKSKGLPWERAKAFDGSAVIGNWLDKDPFDLQNLNFNLHKNGDVVQVGNTSDMLWQIDELIEETSKYFTLKIGDIIFTGTPAGVGKVEIDDVLKGTLEGQEVFSLRVK
jgi:2-keto-4-pentenoate hydratase/2-oxohepta-3-ene-1,7-dioic acid hydratase in catechol pathway